MEQDLPSQVPSFDGNWVVQAMLDAGVSFDDLFDGYSALMDTATPGGNDEYEFRLLAAMTYLVSKWIIKGFSLRGSG